MNSSTPRIVIISACTLVDRFVIRAIARQMPIVATIMPVWEHPVGAPSRFKRLAHNPVKFLLTGLDRKLLETMAELRSRRIATLLGGDGQAKLSHRVIRLPKWSLNTERGVALLRELAPDILLVSGGPLLKKAVLEVPALGALNLHYGLAPWYRGEHTLYMPWVAGDVDHIGVTLHEIDAGIDTGRIVARTTLATHPRDDEAELYVKAAHEFAEMVPACLKNIAVTRQICSQPQEPIAGQLIRKRDRHSWTICRDLLRQASSARCQRVTKLKREWHFIEKRSPFLSLTDECH